MSIERPTEAASEATGTGSSDESSNGTMEMRARRLRAVRPKASSRRRPGDGERAVLWGERVGVLLGAWQAQEIHFATRFMECKALCREQLEDIYQEATISLLERSFESDEHLRNTLRAAIRQRSLNLIRDERRRGEILREHAGELQIDAHAGTRPQQAALSREDRMLVGEFLAELTPLERRIFWLRSEGKGYRAIATALRIDQRRARNATRACERKRETFQSLYETGRLCGYRAQTVQALIDGQQTSEQLAASALLHFGHCAHCAAEHRISARRLRERFNGQIAALLPLPALAARLGPIGRAGLRLRVIAHRVGGGGLAGVGLRERAAALLAGGGAAGKLAAGAATVAVLGGGAIGVTDALTHTHHTPPRHSPRAQSAPVVSALGSPLPTQTLGSSSTGTGGRRAARAARRRRARQAAPGRVVATPSQPAARSSSQPQAHPEPEEGFAYLGVPEAQKPPAPESGEAEGGPFSP